MAYKKLMNKRKINPNLVKKKQKEEKKRKKIWRED